MQWDRRNNFTAKNHRPHKVLLVIYYIFLWNQTFKKIMYHLRWMHWKRRKRKILCSAHIAAVVDAKVKSFLLKWFSMFVSVYVIQENVFGYSLWMRWKHNNFKIGVRDPLCVGSLKNKEMQKKFRFLSDCSCKYANIFFNKDLFNPFQTRCQISPIYEKPKTSRTLDLVSLEKSCISIGEKNEKKVSPNIRTSYCKVFSGEHL